jgi:hypothetical protein
MTARAARRWGTIRRTAFERLRPDGEYRKLPFELRAFAGRTFQFRAGPHQQFKGVIA